MKDAPEIAKMHAELHESVENYLAENCLREVMSADYLGGHKLRILFDDGKEGEFDFATLLDKPFYSKLKDKKEFIQYGLEYGTLVWANGTDISPEILYENIQ